MEAFSPHLLRAVFLDFAPLMSVSAFRCLKGANEAKAEQKKHRKFIFRSFPMPQKGK
jgi:hypothetical protein